MKIPRVDIKEKEARIPFVKSGFVPGFGKEERLLFSFAAVERTDYFNLDGTCVNWASDLFNILKDVSNIKAKDVFSGKYSGRNSTLRIHQHNNVKKTCSLPANVRLEDMWQIRISKSKGGIHGVFCDNVFYVIWFDPQHNLYPDENHGGLKRIKPPSTCCKDREEIIIQLKNENEKLRNEIDELLES